MMVTFLLQLHFYKLGHIKIMKLGDFPHLGNIPMKMPSRLALLTKAK